MPKTEKKLVQTRVRIEEGLLDFLEATAKREGVSRDKILNELLKNGKKADRLKDEGFRLIEHMGHAFTCFHCQEKKPFGKPAWQNDENGATMCIECAYEKYGMSSELNVKVDMKLAKTKKLLKDQKKVIEINREKITAQENRLENMQLLSGVFDKLTESEERIDRILGIKGTPEDEMRILAEHKQWLEHQHKLIPLIIDRKEKEKWEQLQREKKRKKRERQIYA